MFQVCRGALLAGLAAFQVGKKLNYPQISQIHADFSLSAKIRVICGLKTQLFVLSKKLPLSRLYTRMK